MHAHIHIHTHTYICTHTYTHTHSAGPQTDPRTGSGDPRGSVPETLLSRRPAQTRGRSREQDGQSPGGGGTSQSHREGCPRPPLQVTGGMADAAADGSVRHRAALPEKRGLLRPWADGQARAFTGRGPLRPRHIHQPRAPSRGRGGSAGGLSAGAWPAQPGRQGGTRSGGTWGKWVRAGRTRSRGI